jgi:putative copper export protein
MNSVLIFLHVLGIAFWVGGILVYVLVLSPALTKISPTERQKLATAFQKRFGLLTWVAIAVVFVTGTILSHDAAAAVEGSFFASAYGKTLIAKVIVAFVMVLNGAYLGLVLARRMRRAAAPQGTATGGALAGPPPALIRLQKRMATFGWVQVALAVAVLVLNGLL